MIVPSSGPFGATCPYPLCRCATSPLDKGSRPPGGRLKKKAANPPLSLKTSAARLKIPGMAENERKTSQKN